MRLALLQPDIPQNLGANIRLAACLGVALDIIEPCGFPLTDRALRRTAMDYGENARITRHSGWSAFRAAPEMEERRIILLTTKGDQRLDQFRFDANDCILMGRESAGAPEEIHRAADAAVRIPLAEGVRSMNVAVAAGLAVWEALRQTGGLPRS